MRPCEYGRLHDVFNIDKAAALRSRTVYDESYVTGKKTVADIVRESGMSEATFFNKLHEFKEKGRINPPKPKPTLKRTQEFSQRPLVVTDLTNPAISRSFDWRKAKRLAKLQVMVTPDVTVVT